jgi:hypothetical protein
VISKRHARTISLLVQDPNVTELTMNGTTMTRITTTEPWTIEHVATPDTELKISFKSKTQEKFQVKVFDVVEEMPHLPNKTFTPRPDNMTPTPKFDSSTIVSKTYTL